MLDRLSMERWQILGIVSLVILTILAFGVIVYIELPDGRIITVWGRIAEVLAALFLSVIWWNSPIPPNIP